MNFEQFTQERLNVFEMNNQYILETLAFRRWAFLQTTACSVQYQKRSIAAIPSGKEIRGTKRKHDHSIGEGSNENQKDIRNALLRNVGHQQQGLAEFSNE